MISERFQYTLELTNNLEEFEIKIKKAVYDDILSRSIKTDEELTKIYSEYCKKNNYRRDIKRAIKKFREFCEIRNIK